MTAIVGLAENGKVWMGGDAAGVGGLQLDLRSDAKVFVNGEFIFGYTTSFRMGQLLEHDFHPPTPLEGEVGMTYMVRRFIPAVKACFKAGEFSTTENGQAFGGRFLVGYRGVLYLIQSDFQVAKVIQNYAACGCGDELALGSLFSTSKTKMKPKERLLLALEAAQQFSAGVRGPFTIKCK